MTAGKKFSSGPAATSLPNPSFTRQRRKPSSAVLNSPTSAAARRSASFARSGSSASAQPPRSTASAIRSSFMGSSRRVSNSTARSWPTSPSTIRPALPPSVDQAKKRPHQDRRRLSLRAVHRVSLEPGPLGWCAGHRCVSVKNPCRPSRFPNLRTIRRRARQLLQRHPGALRSGCGRGWLRGGGRAVAYPLDRPQARSC